MSLHRLEVVRSHLTAGRLPKPALDPSLDQYRSKGAEFDPSILHRLIDDVTFEYDTANYKAMERTGAFDHFKYLDQSRENLREIFVKQIAVIKECLPLDADDDHENPIKSFSFAKMLSTFDQGLFARHTVNSSLYGDTVHALGTAKHSELRNRCLLYKDYGCFGLTELGHGTNGAGIETRADYDHEKRGFVLNTPSYLGAKWWIGAAGKTANIAAIFAQLYVGGVNQGIQVFAVPIRDYETHQSLPGVILGDCGPKIGLEGIDNGFIYFTNYRVPYDCMLDRFSQIDAAGKFHSKIKNKTKRFSAMLGGLLRGRTGVLMSSCANLRNALTIAIRCSAVRRQFGKPGKPERPILDYPLQRYRILPHLANVFAISFALDEMIKNFKSARQAVHLNPESIESEETHAILSFLKPLSSTYAQNGITALREACGGLAFSAYSYFGQLKSNHDANVTWEGDNNVLVQQTARFLLKNLQRLTKGQKLQAKTLYFLRLDFGEIQKQRAAFETKAALRDSPEELKKMLIHRINWLMHYSVLKLQENVGNYPDVVEAWNHSQVHHLRELALAYGELYLADIFLTRLAKVQPQCMKTHAILMRLFELYVLGIVERDLGTFRESEYLSAAQGRYIKEYVRDLTWELGESAVRIVDAIAYPDFVVGSALGHSDGQVYQRLLDAIESARGVYDTPPWFPLLKQLRPS
jgi:acyl-CoA oxidase